MKVATCVPVAFHADEHFFSRDSGLLCRGFAAIGASAVVVMLGDQTSTHSPLLQYANLSELESSDWWNLQQFDLVVLYGWGDPKFHPIAQAIRTSGATLIQNLDTVGLFSPYVDFIRWMRVSLTWIQCPGNFKQRTKAIYQIARDVFPFIYESQRVAMLHEADYISCVSPFALECVNSYAQKFGGSRLADKVIMVPHPVNPIFNYHDEQKENIIVVVGRWDDASSPQKNPGLLIRVLQKVISQHPNWRAHIIGREASLLSQKHLKKHRTDVMGITFTDFVNHDTLKSIYTKSKIILCVSRHESFHISSAEALCCGCSVVVPDRASLGSTGWFTSNHSGTLCADYSENNIVIAMNDEINHWNTNRRNPQMISNHWCTILHADLVAKNITLSTKNE